MSCQAKGSSRTRHITGCLFADLLYNYLLGMTIRSCGVIGGKESLVCFTRNVSRLALHTLASNSLFQYLIL